MSWFEVHFRLPGGTYAGERLLAYSADDAGRVIRARHPGAEIAWIKKLD